MWRPNGDKKIFVESLPKIVLSADFCRKMWHVVQTIPTEVAWLGEVEGDPRKELRVTNLHIMKQKVSAATFEEEDNALLELKDRIGDAIFKVRAHGHSHVHMGVTPSGTDQKFTVDNMRELQVPYLIRMIANKKGDLRVDFFDFERGINVDCIPFELEYETATFPSLDAELKALLSPLVITPSKPTVYQIGGGKGLVEKKNGTNADRTAFLDPNDAWLYGYGDDEFDDDPAAPETPEQTREFARRMAHTFRGCW